MKRGLLWALLLSSIGIGGWTANATTITSPNYSINGSIGDSIAGGQSSTSYAMTSAGGESIAGQGSSSSYRLGQGYVSTLDNSLQVVVQPNGLAAYWPFDTVTSGGPAIDDSTNNNNGTYSSGSTSYTGKVGQAWSDQNATQQVSIPHSTSLPSGNAMTISGWVRKPQAGGNAAIISKWTYSGAQPNDGAWVLELTPTGGDIRAFIRNDQNDPGNNYVDSTNANLQNNTWYHVAMVYDGTQSAGNKVRLFVNGTQLATATTGTLPASLASSTAPVVVGNFPGLSRYWSGAIDELKLYNRALTADEVTTEYNAGLAGIPAGLGLGAVTAGASVTRPFDTVVQTSSGGYSLAINQTGNLTTGTASIPGVSGTVNSPVTWNEGSTKGLGFTLYGSTASPISNSWSAGSAYAGLPSSPTSFYSRTNYNGGTKDVINMRLRLDTVASQAAGTYANQMVITGTMIP